MLRIVTRHCPVAPAKSIAQGGGFWIEGCVMDSLNTGPAINRICADLGIRGCIVRRTCNHLRLGLVCHCPYQHLGGCLVNIPGYIIRFIAAVIPRIIGNCLDFHRQEFSIQAVFRIPGNLYYAFQQIFVVRCFQVGIPGNDNL